MVDMVWLETAPRISYLELPGCNESKKRVLEVGIKRKGA